MAHIPSAPTDRLELVTFRQALALGTGCVIDCAIDMDAMVHPMVSGGTPVTDFLLD